ncbi:hypothetical protein F4Z98_01690 [Candidatus Poribacteria bacterium]|nr:hypothetical protein [Candidatus Poribacteria bacterium]
MTDIDPTATDLDEPRLIERTQNGETEAFSVLVRKYQDRRRHPHQRTCQRPRDGKRLDTGGLVKGISWYQGLPFE